MELVNQLYPGLNASDTTTCVTKYETLNIQTTGPSQLTRSVNVLILDARRGLVASQATIFDHTRRCHACVTVCLPVAETFSCHMGVAIGAHGQNPRIGRGAGQRPARSRRDDLRLSEAAGGRPGRWPDAALIAHARSKRSTVVATRS